MRRDTIGWGYSLFLPWGSYRPDIAAVHFKTRYERPKGIPIYNESGPVTLNRGANGTVRAEARTVVPQMEKRDALKISVFMNVFNVHSNRAPVDGTVKQRWYHEGAFVNAALDKASTENERNALWIRTKGGRDVTCVQIAGLVARRILCFVREGEQVGTGDRFGMIRFGSRLDIYLPEGTRPLVAEGQTALAGETVIADLKGAEGPRSFKVS